MATLRQNKGSRMTAVGLFIGITLLVPMEVMAHPGRTDSSGCHTCRTNCSSWGLSSGEYHCHNTKALPQPKEPIRSHYGENGTGTTEPWPAYKNATSPTTQSKITPVTKAPTSITYGLAKGMENEQVKRLQQILAKDPSIYPEGQITGYFGPATERALKAFQRKNGLDPVGSTGPKTRALLNR